MKYYTPPDLPPDAVVHEIAPSDLNPSELTADTIVTGLNRGRKTLVCQFNAHEYEIPPGYFREKYSAVLHFKAHLVVPGTRGFDAMQRNLRQDSWIAIPGVDKPEHCQPFTDEDIDAIEGGGGEGLDRDDEAGINARDTVTVSMQSRAARAATQTGEQKRGKGDIHPSAKKGAAIKQAAGAGALAPPAESDAERDARG